MNSKNIGTWSATIDNSGKTPLIVVNGTFLTKGERPLFHLRRNEPQGINSTELLLTLVFGNLADPTGDVEVSLMYSEIILNSSFFKTVAIVDEDGKSIASIEVLNEEPVNIGKWSAEVDNTGKAPLLTVNGIFPTNGEKPLFHLRKNEPQGFIPTQLLLTLVFGSLADPNGPVDVIVRYSQVLATVNDYTSVLVLDGNGRTIASVEVTWIK